MKNYSLLCALTLVTAVAVSGCGSSEIQTITGDISDAGITDTVITEDAAAPKSVDDVVTPTTETAGDPTTPPDNTGGTGTGGTGGGTGGGGRPDLGDIGDLGDYGVVDPTPPAPPTPPSGGGGHIGDQDGIGCHFQGPTSDGRRMRRNDTDIGADADVLSVNDCFIL